MITAQNHQIVLPVPGQLIHVRQRQYLVEAVEPSETSQCSVVRLSCIDDDNQGTPLTVFWEKELDRKILTGENWEKLSEGRFDDPEIFAAYLHTLRWNCVTATDPKLFQSPFRAGIKIETYQLEPLKKALQMPRVNLFIADDVGLGKTIEAGLIIRELLLRKKARYMVVSAPPSMIPQWQSELENRFGLTFQVVDREFIQRIKQERGYAVNPWTTHTRFLISHKLLIEEDYVGSLRDFLGEFESGTIFVLDEAHHAAPSSGSRYAIDSQITKAVRDLAPRFEHRLFLSATPHNGHSNSFSALLEILDPQRFCRGVKVSPKNIKDVLVRRLKDDLRAIQGGFPIRKIVEIPIHGLPEDSPELKLPLLLDEYSKMRDERLRQGGARTKAASQLVVSGLQQRLLSSIEAFAKTLKKHRASVQKFASQKATEKTEDDVEVDQLDLVSGALSSDDDRAVIAQDEVEREVDSQLEIATKASIGSGSLEGELRILEEMDRLASEARGKPDAKIKGLLCWIKENMCPELPLDGRPKEGAAWNDTRIIIFTEWEDTKRYVHQQLLSVIEQTDRGSDRIGVYHGTTSMAQREEIKRAFNTLPEQNPLRILIATDAAREGLNLQSHCWNLFHFDIPWNPSRMEQRNGRIDRKLQPNDEVFCRYFFYRQRPEDRILKRIVEKTETIRAELGSLSKVVDDTLAERLKDGLRRNQIDSFESALGMLGPSAESSRSVSEDLEIARERKEDLQRQLDGLREQLAKSKDWINLSEDSFRSAINSSLNLLQASPLTGSRDGESLCFQFPRLDTQSGAGSGWTELMDSLRAPRKKDERYAEWRRNSPIRPVIFNDPGVLDDRAVHLHLEHRVVQRLLGRFSAQGFTAHDLSRACFLQSEDSVPRIILLGRLALFGPQAARLHEEIISVTARWKERTGAKGQLEPYGRDSERKTLAILEESLAKRVKDSANAAILNRLLKSSALDVSDLLPILESRADACIGDAKDLLVKRAKQEAAEMTKILEEQKRRIEASVKEFSNPQLSFDFSVDEKRQLESNRKYWEKRLGSIERELKEEPQRILAGYEIKASRVEPIGVVYLWPRSEQ